MTTEVEFKRILNTKQWEWCAPNTGLSLGFAAGVSQFWNAKDFKGNVFFAGVNASSVPAFSMYNIKEDGWILMRNPLGITSVGTSSTAVSHNVSVEYTATGGSVNSIITSLLLARDLRGYKLLITDGPGAGDLREIAFNTIGTNCEITVTENFSATITSSTKFKLFTPRLFFMTSPAGDNNFDGSFQEYDFAQNRWFILKSLNVTSTADARLFSTCSYAYGEYRSIATGISSGDNFADTINNISKSWATNQWKNFQIRITSGLGAGQIRTIVSNTATTITVSEKWVITPNYTSEYAIEGNDDFLYYFPYGSTNVFRYNRSTNTWTTLNPSPARTSGFSGCGGAWIDGVTNSDWSNENSIINGRRIIYFAGQNSNVLEHYDIPSNSFTLLINGVNPSISFGCNYEYDGENTLYYQPSTFTGVTDPIFKLDIAKLTFEPFGRVMYSQISPTNNVKYLFADEFNDGGKKLKYLYVGVPVVSASISNLFRTLII